MKRFFRELGLSVGYDLLKSYLLSWVKRYTNLYEVIQTQYIDLAKPKRGAPDYNKLIWLEPAIQSKTSTWSAVNLKKTLDLDELLS